eukprot:gb/GECG01013314.1/.p1 GENE.gb/GECG01013314.1/~~gb/GECG01013314.1/.p1  ORF type:complete len:161 (+),score=17.55 gb/GECG01013314.1/:1-483(+)
MHPQRYVIRTSWILILVTLIPTSFSKEATKDAPEEDYGSECSNSSRILVQERYPLGYGTPPPDEIPADLRWAFTRCGAIPVDTLLVDDSREGKGTHLVFRQHEIQAQIDEASKLLHGVSETILPALVSNEAMLYVIKVSFASRSFERKLYSFPLLAGITR